MGYFSYHNKIIAKIKNNELIKFEIVDSYKDIKPAMLLYFKDGKMYPIRDYMFDKYFSILNINNANWKK